MKKKFMKWMGLLTLLLVAETARETYVITRREKMTVKEVFIFNWNYVIKKCRQAM